MAALPLPLLVALGALWLVLMAGFGAMAVVGPSLKRQRVLRRRLAGLARHTRRVADPTVEARLVKAESRTSGIDEFLANLLPQRAALALRLERTGRTISVTQYLAASAALGVAAGIGAHFARLGVAPSLLVGAAAAIGLPHVWTGRQVKARINKFMLALPEAIDLMVRALRSGLPITEAIVNAGHEVADPVGEEFRRVESALRLGRELDDVLWDMARRLDVPEFRFFVISLGVQRETGGNLAETLANLGEMLRRRRQMKLKIKALSSEARASAMVLAALPFAAGAMMMVTSPDYVGRLFTDPRGLILCMVGTGLMVVGVSVMAKMINFDI